ncbi:DnaB-like helicase C-terminal domain-containing protein [Shewanella baltica]|uniref:DnaB-like helicase C-terminal domain-containing protein n=1 Tax=Shewanella baltica TaxID=62322 RepID=UPI00217DD228|nr:DnaB-like helicase C-terminal domain-containing protein [Shewanella baltica]MCS6192057.1 TIR domain-containing protein [Shewanella baltica]
MENNSVSIFYSYSHKDEKLRDDLETHLSLLLRKGLISSWHDRCISAGQEWATEIDNNIRSADIILLLVSSDFIASEYCYGKELAIAIDNHEANKSIVIPVILRPTDWEGAPFAKLQALPADAKAVTSWSNYDEAWLNVVKGIKKSITQRIELKNRMKKSTGLRSMNDLLERFVDKLEHQNNSESECLISGLETGITDLDMLIDGLHSSQLITIASRPNMGKGDLALNIATHAALSNKLPVAYFTMTMTAEQLTQRLVSSVSSIDSYSLSRATLDDDQWARTSASIGLLLESPLYIDESIFSTVEELRKKCIELYSVQKLKLVVIDSIQHLNPSNSIQGNVTISIPKQLKNLARELNIPIIITSSVPIEIEKRVCKRPILSDLSECHELEDFSDTVLFIYRGEVYNEDSDKLGQAELIIAKEMSNKLGIVTVNYNSNNDNFRTYEKNKR